MSDSFRGTKSGTKRSPRLSPPSRHFRGRSGFLGSSTRTGHYGFFQGGTGGGGGGSGFFDPFRTPQPEEPARRFLNHRFNTFGKRRVVSYAAREAIRFGWLLSPASKALVALEAVDAALTITELGIGYYLYDWKQDNQFSFNPNVALGGYELASGINLCKGTNCLTPVSRSYTGGNWGQFQGGQSFCVIASNAPPSVCNYTCPTPGQAPCAPSTVVTYADNYIDFQLGTTVTGMIILHYTDWKCIFGSDCVWQLLRGTLQSATWVGLQNGHYRMPRVRPVTFVPPITPPPSHTVESMVYPDPLPWPDYRRAKYKTDAVEVDTYGHRGPSRHNRVRPSWGEKEHKTDPQPLKTVLKIVSRIYDAGTEMGDLVEGVWKALPKDARGKDNSIRGMSWDIYNNFDRLDWGKVVLNLGYNYFEDKAIGKFHSYGKKAPYGVSIGHPVHAGPVW